MKRILVTGGNKGIGRAVLTRLLEEHDEVHAYMGARSPQRGDATRKELVAERPDLGERLQVVELDVTSDESVAAAAEVVAAGAKLYGLVNNAGIGRSSGGLRDILEVNTRGMHRVCEAMLAHLDPSIGRIVNITSASGPNFVNKCSAERQRFFLDGTTEWSDIEDVIEEALAADGKPGEFERLGLADGDAYGLSKALANTYTLQLARRHPELAINACTPGFIETDLTRHYADDKGVSPADMGMKSPRDGANAPLHLLFAELEGNGWYYGSDARRSPLDRYRSPGDPPYSGD